MRRWILAGTIILFGCGHTTRYTVDPAALREARALDRRAVPATDGDGAPLWLATDSIVAEAPDGRVEARNPGQGLRTGGWIFTGAGAALGLAAVWLGTRDQPDTGLGDTLGAAMLTVTGGALGLFGLGMLSSAYAIEGPEVPPPPAATAVAPPR